MAVTGAIFNSLVFGGVSSADYGIYITGEAVFNAPKRAVETVSVPGRNGDIIIDQGHWENIEVTYPAGTFGMSETEFRTALSDFRNAVVSQLGYQRLSDTYHPDEYRMGTYVEGLEVDAKNSNKAGQFNLVFNCKPQRWLTSGETAVTVASGDTLTNPTLYDAGPLLMVEGYGTIDIDGNEVVIRDSAVGEITIEPRGTFETEGLVLPLDTSLLQNGDPITFSSLTLYMYVTGKSAVSNVTLIDSSSDFTSSTTGMSGSQFGLRTTTRRSITIQKGETRVLDHTVTARITAGSIVSDVTCTIRVILSAEQLRVARTVTTAEGYHVLYHYTTASSSYARISGVSSLQLGNPTYIDCENGDAYRVDDGAYSSLNKLVTFGPVLPTIKPGGSVITFDSTITAMQVRHNWWKL